MTPEEKAKELTNNFINNVIWQLEDDTTTFLILHEAKQCALICIDEVLENIPMYTGNLNPKWKFFNDVKEEIKKM